jgi:hypothetical protein
VHVDHGDRTIKIWLANPKVAHNGYPMRGVTRPTWMSWIGTSISSWRHGVTILTIDVHGSQRACH